ncbi:hypothetical protein H7Y63_01050 [Polaromonas sp.]|nr:hypothetical protein [Candidatus Saccharibacteria bacterium]
MNESLRNALLVISSIILVTSTVPYLLDIIKKKTKPRVVSWFNWGILGAVAGAAALADGQVPAAVLSFASVIEVMLVVILGLCYGDRRFQKIDLFCQVGAAIGLALWFALDSPLTAIVIITLVDFIAAIPTYLHIWRAPEEETLAAFILACLASGIALATVTSLALTGLVYPIYLFAANALMAGLIVVRRRAS